jgi:hypothetical protein
MIFPIKAKSQLQERLDQTRDLEDVVPDQAANEDDESPFQMTGLYEIIPGADPSPMRIDSWTSARQV